MAATTATAVAETFNILQRAKVAVVIDGAHIYAVSRGLGFDIDFEKLRLMLSKAFDVRRMSYALKVAVDERGDIVQAPIARLLDYLRFNGYRTVVEEYVERLDSNGRRLVRTSIDVAIATSLLTAVLDGVQEVILFAGSDELVAPIRACAQRNTRVTLVSSIKATPQVSNSLRSAADWFVELADLREQVARAGSERSVERAATLSAGDPDGEASEERAPAGSLGARARVVSRGG